MFAADHDGAGRALRLRDDARRHRPADDLRGRLDVYTQRRSREKSTRGQDQRNHRRLFGERAFELVKHDREHDEAANERALPECVDSQQQETVADHLD